MQANRNKESGPIPYRTGRFFIVDSVWYFTTREGLDHGPFPTREKAEQGCLTYIQVCLAVEDKLNQRGKLSAASQAKSG